jgi:hypothetical protein
MKLSNPESGIIPLDAFWFSGILLSSSSVLLRMLGAKSVSIQHLLEYDYPAEKKNSV